MTPVRRSNRARQQATSIYDEAKKEIEQRDSLSPKASRVDKDHSDDDDDDSKAEVEIERDEEESDEEESSDDEGDFKPKPKARAASEEKKTKPKPLAKKKAQVKVGRQAASTRITKTTDAGGTQTRKGVTTALANLGRKVLDKAETPETSLVAALLQAYKESGTKQRRAQDEDTTMHTPGLQKIARRVLKEYQQDHNKAQVDLLNLLFRSVGGTLENYLDPNDTHLEEMDDGEWGAIVTDLVDVMRHTPSDLILLCADPDGAQHACVVATSKESETVPVQHSSLGVREYRKIYEEFWYVLGTVALTEGIARSDGTSQDESGNEDSVEENPRHDGNFAATGRFEAEVVRDLILRVSELVTVGQPDIRAAATVAAFRLGHAVLNRTVALGAKLEAATRQFDAATSGKKKGELSRKAESFKVQMDSIKRTRAELEEIVESSLIKGVFMHRYRDSDMFIRAESLKSLSKMTLQRPDLFLNDKYLKYFGWMTSDKCACVRVASLAGLYAPFQLLEEAGSQSRKRPIDTTTMQNVIDKFLPRIADCVVDLNLDVQEHAMSLLLSLLREGFFDDVNDDNIWNQINILTLDDKATPKVRRNALYFLMDQMESFDEDEDGKSSDKSGQSNDKRASLAQSSERMMVQRLDSLASWIAHQLVDGPVPIEKIRVQLADLFVHSLRAMPEHKELVTNWTAMLRAISDDSVATTVTGGQAGDRAEVAKQRVLVQMLACAAQLEVVDVAETGFLSRDLDSDAFDQDEGNAPPAKPKKSKGASKLYSGGMAHEKLSVALLSSLPDLLIKFKGDHAVLGSLTVLPRYILPSVLSLSQRKAGFLELVKNLSDIFLESSDECVLQNVALSLVSLSRGGHTRAADAQLHLRRVASSLSVRVMELLASEAHKKSDTKKKSSDTSRKSSKRKISSRSSASSQSSASSNDSDEVEVDSESRDVEYAISLSLRRLRILSKRCDLSELLDDDVADEDATGHSIDELCDAVVDGMMKRLKEREVIKVTITDDEEPKVTIPDIWHSGDDTVHELVASSVNESLSLLLSVSGWKVRLAEAEDGVLLQEDEDPTSEQVMDTEDADKHGVLRLRQQIMSLLVLCFEQFLPDEANLKGSETKYSEAHIAFADQVQAHACKISGDIRSLFLKEWANAASPLLRECASNDDAVLAGGLIRYLRSKEEQLGSDDGGKGDVNMARDILLPLGRSLAPNWKLGNRREAGIVLAHVAGTGPETGKIVTAISRVLKKIHPVRLLEAHMASLRQSYEDWEQNEPNEPESDHPSDDEMAKFAEDEERHRVEFQAIEQQAASLSRSLGVGKLSDPKLAPSLLGFVREGIKFAFTRAEFEDAEGMLGSRLSFLTVLSKYTTWIKRDKAQREELRRELDEKETDLRNDDNFDEVHVDDLAALAKFRKALGVKGLKRKDASPSNASMDAQSVNVTDYSSDEDDYGTRSVSSGKRRRLSQTGSVSSGRSRASTVHTARSLSPLKEEDSDSLEEESPKRDESPPLAKKRGRRSRTVLGGSLSVSTSQSTIAEEEASSESEGEGSY